MSLHPPAMLLFFCFFFTSSFSHSSPTSAPSLTLPQSSICIPRESQVTTHSAACTAPFCHAAVKRSSRQVTVRNVEHGLCVSLFCVLCHRRRSQGRCAEDLYKGIQSSDAGVRCDSLKELASVSTDVTFAQEFISRDGHLLLVKIVEDSNELVLCVCVCA